LRFVLDTNVIVSALLIPDSTPRRAFDKALHEGAILISHPAMLELADVLGREKLNKYLLESERMRFLVGLLKEVELVHVTTTNRRVS
jgi:putative PIN family toxin of toxin-antitoxin system